MQARLIESLALGGPSLVPGGSGVKESACNTGDMSSMPGSGRSPGGRHASLYSCLGNTMVSGACQAAVHGVAKSQR